MPAFSVQSPDLLAFQKTLATYASLSKKSLDEILLKKGRSLSFALYQETRYTAPEGSNMYGAV